MVASATAELEVLGSVSQSGKSSYPRRVDFRRDLKHKWRNVGVLLILVVIRATHQAMQNQNKLTFNCTGTSYKAKTRLDWSVGLVVRDPDC